MTRPKTSGNRALHIATSVTGASGVLLGLFHLTNAVGGPGNPAETIFVLVHLFVAALQVVPALGLAFFHPRLRGAKDSLRVGLLLLSAPSLVLGVLWMLAWR